MVNQIIVKMILNDKIRNLLCFRNIGYLSLDFLRIPFILNIRISLNYIILTEGKVKDKEHPTLRCLV